MPRDMLLKKLKTIIKQKIQAKIKVYKNRYSLIRKKNIVYDQYTKLHLGCGFVYFNGYLNVDVSKNSVADLIDDYRNVLNNYDDCIIKEILMVHSIGYLTYFQAEQLFTQSLKKLSTGGKLILEFPDIINCAQRIVEASKNNTLDSYMEGVRAFYAFDMTQIANKTDYYPYKMGWSSWHLANLLTNIGYSTVIILKPEYHETTWRDSRIEATK